MKKFTIAALALTSALSLNAQAEETQDEYTPFSYFGVHLGNANTELNGGGQDFGYFHLGGTYGYQYSENFAFESVASLTVGDERDDIVSDLLGQTARTQFNSIAGYLVAKSSGSFYVKGKAGLSYASFVYTASGYEDEVESTFGLSYGIGLGIEGEKFNFEFELTKMPEVDDPIFPNDSYDTTLTTVNLVFNF